MADDSTPGTVALILAWHDAVNAGRIEEVLALTTEDVRVGGPRGSASGQDVLADWVSHAGIQLTPRVIHEGARALYVEQDAQWPSAGASPDGIPACTVFEMHDDRIAALLRYDSLEDALAAMSDRVTDEVWRDA